MTSTNPSQALNSNSNLNPNPNPNAAMSPELEQTLSMLSSHRSVLGYMLVTRGHHPSIIRHSGVVFDGEQGKRYAAVVARIVESVQAGLEEVRVDDGLTAAATGETDVVRWFFLFRRSGLILIILKDEIRFMRIRTKKHEILISPGECQ
jgi:dynein light chain roadblock-type